MHPRLQAETPPAAPQQVPHAVVPGANITIPIPMSRAQIRALLSRRDELGNQLGSAQGRRASLAHQLQSPSVVDRAGLEAQVKFLDARILNIESDIAENGTALASIPASLRQSTQQRPPFGNTVPGVVSDLTGLLVVALLVPFAFIWARRVWRRDSARPVFVPPPRWEEGLDRMQRLETALDAIAIEVERVSEGQRFITRVLAEPGDSVPAAASSGEPSALGVGDRPLEPVRLRHDATAAARLPRD